jgi:hypothetical protein
VLMRGIWAQPSWARPGHNAAPASPSGDAKIEDSVEPPSPRQAPPSALVARRRDSVSPPSHRVAWASVLSLDSAADPYRTQSWSINIPHWGPYW